MQKRITVGLRQDVYDTLASRGRFGESFSDVVSRLIEESGAHISSNKGEELG
jgi:predicted CopG family antitoxin